MALALHCYGVLTEDEVKRLTRKLAGRVEDLEKRYDRPLPQTEQEVEAYSAKVEGHLKRMGLSPCP